MNRSFFWAGVLAAAAVSGLLRTVYAARLGPPVRGDEAVNACMALRISRGQDAPLFLYGVDYLSSLEAWAAGAVWRAFGVSDFTFRILPLISSVVSIVLLGILARRLFGGLTGVLSAWILALAPPFFLHMTAIAIGGYAEGLLASLAVWLAFVALRRQESSFLPHSWGAYGLEEKSPRRGLASVGARRCCRRFFLKSYAAFSILTAFACWIYPMTLGFLIPIALVWLKHPEGVGSRRFPWRDFFLPHRADGMGGGWGMFAAALQTANLMTLLLLAVILATGGGKLRWGSVTVGLENGAKVAIWNVVLSVFVVGLVAWRRRVFPTTRGLLALAAGVALAKAIWLIESWRVAGGPPLDIIHLRFKLAQGGDWLAHLKIVFTEVLPAVLGFSLGNWDFTGWRVPAAVALGGILAGLVLRGALPQVNAMRSLARAAPDGETLRGAFLSILWILPVLNIARGGPGMPIRYWAYLWPILAVAMGAGIARGIHRPGWGARVRLAAGVLFVGVLGTRTVQEIFARTPFDVAKPKAVLTAMPVLGAQGGYAEYDLANALTFLSGERYVFAPFDYRNRIPGIAERLAQMDRILYLFHRDGDSPDRPRARALARYLEEHGCSYRRELAGNVEIYVVEGAAVPLRWQR